MAEEKKKASASKRIVDSERFKYIGFEVFPGKPKDIFSSEAEKKEMVRNVMEKRATGDALHRLREDCTLLEDRVTLRDRIVLTVACVAMFVSLFIPWFSAYNETVTEPKQSMSQVVADSSTVTDSAMLAMTDEDTLAGLAGTASEGTSETQAETAVQEKEGEESSHYTENSGEEIIHGLTARKKIHKEYSRLSGFGSFLALGSVGSYVFSSGGVMAVTAIVFILMMLLCIALPAYTLYGLFVVSGDIDQKALKLKKILALNWLPLVLFLAGLILSFIGGNYGFNPITTYASIGAAYGPEALINTLSWGVYISVGASILLAVKGIEI
ncbi:MAG: hypothetical protein U9R56_01970 [candidate division Zixibacteria bacterium]|nr:hypothetical protein [candidate division Zixibacteria bacterium]